jgi:hypothetical protein
MEAFAPDSGVWTVKNGSLRVSAESLGGDAASVFHVSQMLPQYFEIQASITMQKPIAGWKANSYVIFDYYSPTDFKFAGLNASLDKIQMGHRDETGWVVDVQDNMQIKPGVFYNILVAVNGTTVTVLADNTEFFSHTFAPRVIDGWVYGLNSGMVGFGSDNARGVFDNIAVQVLPPEVTFEGTEEFPDSHVGIGFVPSEGVWQIDGGRYNGTPGVNDIAAVSLIDLGLDHGFEVSSVLEIETTVTTDGTAGFIFDYYAPDDFKFAAIDAVTGQAIIGHYTGRNGWVTDAAFDVVIEPGVDYVLNLSLKGSTVSLSVKEAGVQNWQAMVGYAYNAVTVDGGFGLLSKDGSGSFDEVAVKTNDPAFEVDEADTLMAAAAPQQTNAVESLTDEQLAPVVEAAIDRLTESLGLDDSDVALLESITFEIADLSGLTLGQADGTTIVIDSDAAGYGWFVDTTPYEDSEFDEAWEGSLVDGRMDLLTAVMHELGHILGLEDIPDEKASDTLMSDTLDAAVRQLEVEVDASPVILPIEYWPLRILRQRRSYS